MLAFYPLVEVWVRGSILLVLLICACDPRGSQLRLSWQGATDTTMTVTWRSPHAMDALVLSSGALEQITVALSAPHAGDYRHTVEFVGLTPGRTYHYQTESSEGRTPLRSFRTAPDPAAPFCFAVVGDTQDNDDQRARVRAAIERVQPDFTLHTGDLVEDGNNQDQWEQWFNTMQPLIAGSPLMPAVGNHDGSQLYYDQFVLPRHHPSSSPYPDEAYYAFDYGGVHFVSLSTEPLGGATSPQLRWLEQDLAAAAARTDLRWIVVFAHRPPYTSGAPSRSNGVRRLLVPLFERYDVDLTFWGHEHVYERTWPLQGGLRVAQGGVTYVVTGGGGGKLRHARTGPLTAVTRSIHHFVEVDVSPWRLRLRARGVDHQIIDAFSIHKDIDRTRRY